VNEIFLQCDPIGFKKQQRTDENGSKVEFTFGALEEETACHMDGNKSQICKKGYSGFLCGACEKNYGHGSRKSTCEKCDPSNAGPWLRMALVVVIGMCIVAYIVKRKTRKQSASLERVGLL
jgi:hypothetical protein